MPRPVRPADFILYRSISDPSFSPDCRRIAFSVRRANMDDDSYDSDIYVVDSAGGQAEPFTTGKKDYDPKWSPDGASILFLSRRQFSKDDKGNALYLIGAKGGEAKLLHKSKDGIDGPQWAPDSKSIFFLSYTSRKQKDDVKVIRRLSFWFNGLGFVFNRRRHLFRLNVATGSVTQLTRGEFDIGDFAISNDGGKIAYLASTNELRPYISDVFLISAKGGRRQKLTKSNMEIGGLAWSPDDGELAISGDELPYGLASHSRVMTLNRRSGKVALAEDADRNKGNSLNSDARSGAHGPGNLVWDNEGIYYVQADGASAHLYLAKPGGRTELVIGGERSVEGYDARAGKVAFVAMSSDRLQELYLKSGKERALTKLNSGAYETLDILSPERLTFLASDGETVEGWVLLPKGKAKVPGILYVHGGPKTAFGNAFMHEFQTFAGAGYAVIYLNPRGSDGYSERFADIRGRYGSRDFDDLMEGLDFVLKKYPQIDEGRLGIAGGSYGGYMTNWAIGHTTRFSAAVTDRSIASWTSFWGTSDIGPFFTEDQAGGDPWDSADKLRANSPMTYAPNVETPLLLVHSMEDYRCWMVEGLEFYTALKKLGKEAELVLFPGENHDLSRMGKPKHRVARLNHYLRWFDAHLKRGR